MRLLIVEDDHFLGAALKNGLELEGYAVDWVKRGDDLPIAMAAETYEVILLDLELPYTSGLDALRALRDKRDGTPVIIISAQDRLAKKVESLDAGADDYLVKPLDLEEVMARVRAQIRRRDSRPSHDIVVGNIRVSLFGRSAWLHDQTIALTAREYKVLSLLMRRAGRFVSKGEIEGDIYEDSVEIESNTIEVAISALRRKLGRDTIITARGLGYMIPS